MVTDEQNTPSVKEEEVEQRREKLHETLNPELDAWNFRTREYPVCRVPFAVRDEIARNLQEMQDANVIQPSNSPWASPMVLVRRTLCFCVDYLGLNSAMKLDQFPLPRIDNLLDQLGKSCYFTMFGLSVQILADSS